MRLPHSLHTTVILVVFALVAQHANAATHSNKQHPLKFITQNTVARLSVDELVDYDVDSVECTNEQFNRDLKKRVDAVAQFFGNDPKDYLEKSLCSVNKILSTLQDIEKDLQQRNIGQSSLAQIQKAQAKIEMLLLNSSNTDYLYPALVDQFNEITQEQDDYENEQPEERLARVQKAILFVSELKGKFEQVIERLQSYKQSIGEIQAKINKQLEKCSD